MKVKKIVLNVFIPFLSLLFATGISSGQTLNEAKEAFNNGVSAIQSDSLDEAILQFNKCMEIYSGLDEYDSMEAEDMIVQIETKLPALYYQVAMDLYKKLGFKKAYSYYYLEKSLES